jgi:transcriptional regulator with XRE-family HTH domain
MADSQIGTSLKAARERLDWSRETLAHHSGISWSAIAQIESGRRADIRLSSLSALASALGVPVDYLSGSVPGLPAPLLQHRVLVYRSTDECLAAVVPFLREGVERSDALLVVINAQCARSARKSLGDDAEHVEFADAGEWYSSPAETLRRYRSFIDGRLEAGARWIRIVGEPVWADRSRAQIREWTRYESILNLSLANAPATIVCPYNAESVPASILRDAGRTHPECAELGGSTRSASYCAPEDFLLRPDVQPRAQPGIVRGSPK